MNKLKTLEIIAETIQILIEKTLQMSKRSTKYFFGRLVLKNFFGKNVTNKCHLDKSETIAANINVKANA